MNFTEEQMAIINATGNIKINAVAGSGKTTTIIEYAKTRPQGSNILYIAFNKSVKIEASKRFAAIGLNNVTVETAHSLAYKHIVYSHQYKVKNQDYKINEIAEILGLKASGEKHAEYIIANHIIKFIAYFCNSNQQKVQDLNYLDTITDPKAKVFVVGFYAYIEAQTRIFLSKMNSGEIEITHDFYLKKFQLSNPQLYYNYILFDEAQDASAAMLDVFLKQAATKVIVGDTHQQIYGWRYAVNSLEKVHFNTLHLSTSFRFEKNIAHLAVAILDWKEYINDDFTSVKIIGKGNHKTKQSKAVIARTNLGLLLKAIEYVTEKKDLKNIYFEGNINSYTYADEGTSLYDVLNLFLGKKHLIKDSLIKLMKNETELEEYIEKTEDVQLGMMLEIVKKYEDDIPSIIKKIKEKHIADNDKEKAEIIFSTVHRCKGMEYDVVTLVNDFITQERIESEKEEVNKAKLNEEINLLYVAVTRAKTELHIPEKLLSKGFVAVMPIKVIKTEVKKEEQQPKKKYQYSKAAYKTNSFTQTQNIRDEMVETNKAYSVEKLRETHNGTYQPWTHYLDNELKTQFNNNVKVVDIAAHFGRTNSAIYSRLKKLNLVKQ